jgi:hypothetical protein
MSMLGTCGVMNAWYIISSSFLPRNYLVRGKLLYIFSTYALFSNFGMSDIVMNDACSICAQFPQRKSIKDVQVLN